MPVASQQGAPGSGEERAGQPGGKPDTSFTSRARACLAMPSPGPAGCQDRPRLGKEREGGHPKALGTPCQQTSVLWQHSRPDSNSETKDFLPRLASHQFPRALPGARVCRHKDPRPTFSFTLRAGKGEGSKMEKTCQRLSCGCGLPSRLDFLTGQSGLALCDLVELWLWGPVHVVGVKRAGSGLKQIWTWILCDPG